MKRTFLIFIVIIFSFNFILSCNKAEEQVETDVEVSEDEKNGSYTVERVPEGQERAILGELVVRKLSIIDSPSTDLNWIGMNEFIEYLNGIVRENVFDEALIREFAPKAGRFNTVWIGSKKDCPKAPHRTTQEGWERMDDNDIIIMF